MKPDLIIDCNTLSNLSNIEINRSKPNSWLWQYFNIHITKVIYDEFNEGSRNASANYKAIKRKIDNTRSILRNPRVTQIEKRWLLGRYYKRVPSKEDAGEREFICLTLDLVKNKLPLKRWILVSDDDTAKKSFLNEVKDDTNFGEIWSSLDLLLFLFLAAERISYNQAFEAIRTIISLTSISAKKFKAIGDNDEISRQKMLFAYIDKLGQINKLKTI
jgi:hypothetical protein